MHHGRGRPSPASRRTAACGRRQTAAQRWFQSNAFCLFSAKGVGKISIRALAFKAAERLEASECTPYPCQISSSFCGIRSPVTLSIAEQSLFLGSLWPERQFGVDVIAGPRNVVVAQETI